MDKPREPDAKDWPAYALRMGLAATFVAAGLDHAVRAGGMAWAVRFLPDPVLGGQILAWGELAAGIALAAGLLVPLSLLAAGFIASGAMLVVALGGGGFVWQDLVMGGAAVFALAHGGGPAALDDALLARWPRTRRWLRPADAHGLQRASRLVLRGALGGALLGVTAIGIWQGAWSAPTPARLSPALGVAVFVARAAAGAIVLAGIAPRLGGGLVAGVGLAYVLAAPAEYHAYILVAAGLAMAAWPAAFQPDRPVWLPRRAAGARALVAEEQGLARREAGH